MAAKPPQANYTHSMRRIFGERWLIIGTSVDETDAVDVESQTRVGVTAQRAEVHQSSANGLERPRRLEHKEPYDASGHKKRHEISSTHDSQYHGKSLATTRWTATPQGLDQCRVPCQPVGI